MPAKRVFLTWWCPAAYARKTRLLQDVVAEDLVGKHQTYGAAVLPCGIHTVGISLYVF